MTLITPSEPSSILNETGAVKSSDIGRGQIFVAMMLSFCGQVKSTAGATCRRKEARRSRPAGKALRFVTHQAIVAVKRRLDSVDLAFLHCNRFVQRDGTGHSEIRAGSGDDFQHGIGLNVSQRFERGIASTADAVGIHFNRWQLVAVKTIVDRVFNVRFDEFVINGFGSPPLDDGFMTVVIWVNVLIFVTVPTPLPDGKKIGIGGVAAFQHECIG